MKTPRKSRKRTEASRWIRLYRIGLTATNTPEYVETRFAEMRLVVEVMERLGRVCRATTDGSSIILRGRR